MSILIKGMEMPTNCVDCGIYWDGCPVYELENIDKDYSEKRAPNCPVVPVPFHKIVMTNADCIRAMSDEELAMIICCQDHKQGDECFDASCYDCTLDWLKQEVDDG